MLSMKQPPHTLHSSEKSLILEPLWKYLSLTHISEDDWLIFELHSLELNLAFPSEFAENWVDEGLTWWWILVFIIKKIKSLQCEGFFSFFFLKFKSYVFITYLCILPFIFYFFTEKRNHLFSVCPRIWSDTSHVLPFETKQCCGLMSCYQLRCVNDHGIFLACSTRKLKYTNIRLHEKPFHSFFKRIKEVFYLDGLFDSIFFFAKIWAMWYFLS